MTESPSGYFLPSSSEHWTDACVSWFLSASASLPPCLPISLSSLPSSLLSSSLPFSPLDCSFASVYHGSSLFIHSFLSSSSVLDSIHHCSAHLCTLSHYAAFTTHFLLACLVEAMPV